ncbi:MAG: phosphoribosylanthranilate isomerase [Pseudomonadota bacterium]
MILPSSRDEGDSRVHAQVKICGLTTTEAALAAANAGADYLGFNFYSASPRSISLSDAAKALPAIPGHVKNVALVVDPDDAMIDRLLEVPFDVLQLHGSEPPERVVELRAKARWEVMKVVGIADAADLEKIGLYEAVADQLLIDAKPPRNAELPGGNGVRFDWRLIAGRHWTKPWMLAGGLTPANVAEAIELTGATQVDVASGVEESPGVKSPALMRDFVAAARVNNLAA